MDQRWTLHVKNMGKVVEADIQIAPLICFVGDNNSGKSYIMTLLWGLINNGRKELFFDIKASDTESSEAYKKCYNWLKNHIDEGQVQVDEKAAAYYISWFNELLDQKKDQLLKKLFNFNLHASKIEIRDFKLGKPVDLFFAPTLETVIPLLKKKQGPLLAFGKDHEYEYTDRDLLRINRDICWAVIMRGLGSPYEENGKHIHEFGEPIYFPASRTGFLLTYKQFISSIIENNEATLTLPYVDFLKLLIRLEPADEKNLSVRRKRLLQFIQTKIMHGYMQVEKEYAPTFRYRPQGTENFMPLHITSSVVTEVAPLALLLQSDIRFRTIVIEEPEAHLHPALQKLMAQCIIRLVNSGYNVWITTHSDVILQHINNMIKLYHLSDTGTLSIPKKFCELMKKFQYENQDVINPRQIAMYQFSYYKDQGIPVVTANKIAEGEMHSLEQTKKTDVYVESRPDNLENGENEHVKNITGNSVSLDNAGIYSYPVNNEMISKTGTYVTKLEFTKYGFIVPTFNDALNRILEEVYAFQGDED